ncbi:formate dehydrogenase accessory sulfurtransferase FdhD [Achromobacter agilis]|uniref:Sulfur carrier protein FdhD n=1 Tax=Achromobacter agilis TaxID=1353888 RepID=A0A446CT08_9BURK|nr:formate dehydrogenase accessory sulfurtransferase FdhD [Achromobacter agilis]SSW70973.1 Sulfurtransferase FdhD [Achromobacter agilis]
MPPPLPSSRSDCAQVQVTRLRAGALEPGAEPDYVALETPVALEFNGVSHATMLATPADLEDFAVGFSLSEGIIGGIGDVRGIDLLPQPDGIVVQVEISTACEVRLRSRRRAMAGRTGCGLCGVETLPEVLRPVAPVANPAPVSFQAVLAAMRDIRARQALHDITGATHAAGWAGAEGTVALVREDVGRHNALDKLVGALARQGVRAGDGILAVSSRASFEMVQKTAAAGVRVLAAVSAPTSLAIRLANDANVTLLGFLRGDDATLYSHPERIIT